MKIVPRSMPPGSSPVETSKLGELEDTEHASLNQLAGHEYGRPVLFLRRRQYGQTSSTDESKP